MVTKERRFSSNVTDPVADLLTRIRNANLAYKDDLAVPVSKVNESVLRILDAEGYIDGFEREGEGVHQAFRVRLKYGKQRQRTISGIKRISTPGRRVYTGRDEPAARAGRPRHRDRVDVAGRDDRQGRLPQGHRRRGARLRLVGARGAHEGTDTMSRIGKQPIEIPSGVDVTVGDGERRHGEGTPR